MACGRLDAYFEMNLQPWDFSAGKLILEEAAGRITQWNNKKLDLSSINNVLASNGCIHDQLIRILEPRTN